MSVEFDKYGKSEHGNFFIVDKIAVQHPYCITGRHVGIASDQFGGMLSEAAIVAAEKQGAYCGICKGKLSYKQHETALLVSCLKPIKLDNGEADPELHQYLLKIKEEAENDKFAGFAFKQSY